MKLPILTGAFVLAATSLLAQQNFSTNVNITSTDTANPNLKVDGNGGVLFKGTGTTTGSIPASGAGTRLLWYPAKSAFRAGVVNGTQWNDSEVGVSSAAFGVNNRVFSTGGFASGQDNNVGYGWFSAIFGGGNTISDASQAFVVGGSNLVGNGFNNFIAGGWNTVSKSTSVAIGEANTSTGWGAMTIGRALTSASAGCVVVGLANTPIVGNDTYWVGTDPVFIVGNGANGSQIPGQSAPTQSNALVIYKNGDVKIPKAQGDISMGEFAP
jgi:hypothetical protein